MTFQGSVQTKCGEILWNSRKDNTCDISFIVGKQRKKIKAHKAFLAAFSPVFKQMLFECDIKNKLNQDIRLKDDDPDAFESMLKFTYCCDPQLNQTNVIKVRKIAQKYIIEPLYKLCDEYLLKIVTYSNVCTLLNEASECKIDSCIDIIRKCMTQRFKNYTSTIINSPQFLKMRLSAMKELLQWNCLQVTEDALFTAVLKWADAQTRSELDNENAAPDDTNNKQKLGGIDAVNKRRKLDDNRYVNAANANDKEKQVEKQKKWLLMQIYPLIRFGLMSGTYFVRNVKPLKILTDTQVGNVSCYILDPNAPNATCGGVTVTRRSGNYKQSAGSYGYLRQSYKN